MQLEEPLRQLWFPTPDRATAYETSFIVVGPIPNDNPGHLTTGSGTNAYYHSSLSMICTYNGVQVMDACI